MNNALTGAPWLKSLARVFDQAGAPLYIVGGAVRNPLMGLPLSDIDACGPTRPETICVFCEGTEVRTVLRAAQFGTVELHVTDENGQPQMAEYTAWREDSYQAGHRPDSVTFTTDITVDARRRDFSVNALYQQVHENGLSPVIDPTGGLSHLEKGLLCTVQENPDNVLCHDGHRILRGARFQAELDLQVDDTHLASMRRYAHLIAEIAPSRKREEIAKLIMADFAYPTLKRRFPAAESGLRTLHLSGTWPFLFGKVAYDEAAVSALKRLALPSLPARLALLCRHADPADAEAMLKALQFPAKDAAQTLAVLRAVQQALSPMEAAKLGMDVVQTAREILRALENEAAIAQLDHTLNTLRGKPLSLKELAVSGADLKPLFLKQGRPMKDMGVVLDRLWMAVLEGKAENQKEALLALVSSLLK